MQITGRPAGLPGFYLAALAGVCGRNERDSETPGQRRMPASRGVGRGQLTCQLGPRPLPGGDLEGRGEPWLRGRAQHAGRRVQGAGLRPQGAGRRRSAQARVPVSGPYPRPVLSGAAVTAALTALLRCR